MIGLGAAIGITVAGQRLLDGPDAPESRVVDGFLSGKFVRLSAGSWLDDGIRQLKLIERKQIGGDTVVLGSSRVMPIDASAFQGQKFFNHAVSGAMLGDHIALFEQAVSVNKIPASVILGIDPWIFGPTNSGTQWRSLAFYYQVAAWKLSLDRRNVIASGLNYIVLRFLSFDSLLRAAKALIFENETDLERRFVFTDKPFSGADVYRPDGSVKHYYRKSFQSTLDRYRKFRNLPRMANYVGLDPVQSSLLRQFVFWMKRLNVQVLLFLPPYHPIVLNELRKSGEISQLIEIEETVRMIAAQTGAQVVGGYDKDKELCDRSEFNDADHPNLFCLKKYIGLNQANVEGRNKMRLAPR